MEGQEAVPAAVAINHLLRILYKLTPTNKCIDYCDTKQTAAQCGLCLKSHSKLFVQLNCKILALPFLLK